jgi:hypothetical protein
LIWFVIGFLGVEGNAMPVKLFPHRFWPFLAIPLAIIVAEGLFIFYVSLADKKAIIIPVLALIILGIMFTSAYPKYAVQTAQWPPGMQWSSTEELQGYFAIGQTLPKGSSIFTVCSDEEKAIGFDMYAPPLDVEIDKFKRELENKSVDDIYELSKKKNFEYLTVDGLCSNNIGVNKTNELLSELSNSSHFETLFSNKGVSLFRIK